MKIIAPQSIGNVLADFKECIYHNAHQNIALILEIFMHGVTLEVKMSCWVHLFDRLSLRTQVILDLALCSCTNVYVCTLLYME